VKTREPPLGAVVCAAAITALNVTAADAASQVERGPEHANLICSFSGLNDDPEEDGNRTQSYGQLVKDGLKPFVPSPGVACNPNTVFEEYARPVPGDVSIHALGARAPRANA
jgi:hypothetical protein